MNDSKLELKIWIFFVLFGVIKTDENRYETTPFLKWRYLRILLFLRWNIPYLLPVSTDLIWRQEFLFLSEK